MRNAAGRFRSIGRTALMAGVLLFAAPLLRAEGSHADGLAEEAPRVTAALEQGLAAETGRGFGRNPRLALALYCDAGIMGSAEGFFRVGRILAQGPADLRDPALANAYYALAARLGHHAARDHHDHEHGSEAPVEGCGRFGDDLGSVHFNLGGYLAGLSPARRRYCRPDPPSCPALWRRREGSRWQWPWPNRT